MQRIQKDSWTSKSIDDDTFDYSKVGNGVDSFLNEEVDPKNFKILQQFIKFDYQNHELIDHIVNQFKQKGDYFLAHGQAEGEDIVYPPDLDEKYPDITDNSAVD